MLKKNGSMDFSPEVFTPRKYQILKEILERMGSVLVAFSGGVDSSFLLKVSCDVLGGNVLAVTAVSAARCDDDASRAQDMAKDLRVRHILIKTDELSLPEVSGNDVTRCYHCKKYVFLLLKETAAREGLAFVADGSNRDDGQYYRPGLKAVEELGIRSPLKEAGLGKEEIRQLSRQMNLPTWNLPSQSCLLTRFPYGTTVSEEAIANVKQAERFITGQGFSHVRVRVLERNVRVEVAGDELSRVLEEKAQNSIRRFLQESFLFETLTFEGYRFGSMDEGFAAKK